MPGTASQNQTPLDPHHAQMELLAPGAVVGLQPSHMTEAHRVHASHHNVRVSEQDRRARQAGSTASFRVRAALDGSAGGVSLESVLYPGHFIVHASGQHVEIAAGEACGCAPGTAMMDIESTDERPEKHYVGLCTASRFFSLHAV